LIILVQLLVQAVPLTPAINLKPVTASANPAGTVLLLNWISFGEREFKETHRLARSV
jgi:hypothetical protein